MSLNGSAAATGALGGAAAGTAVMPGIGTAVGAVAGGLAGLFSGGGQDATALANEALQNYNGISTPTTLSDPLALETYQTGGTLSPALQQVLNLNADKATTLVENPQNRAQQEAALSALQQLSQSGMSANDLAQLQASRSQVAQDTQAKIQSLLQQQQMRGQGNAGSTLAAQLSAIQGGNQTQSRDALSTAASAEQARNAALAQYASLAGQIRQADLGTQEYNTTNDIQRQRFLDQNSLSRQAANVSAQNNASLYNLQRAQSVADANTSSANTEAQRQVAAQQQEYEDQLQLASGKANALNGVANTVSQQNANQAQNFANTINGVGSLATAYAKANGSGSSSSDSSGYDPTDTTNTNADSYTMPTLGSQYGS